MALARTEIQRSLKRLFSAGRLELLPKRDTDRQLLFALAAWKIQEHGADTEQAINDLLEGWLSAFCHTVSLDHVTFRRALVDAGFIGRTNDGARYWINAQQIHRTLAPDGLDVDPGATFAEARRERDERKRRYLHDKSAHRERK